VLVIYETTFEEWVKRRHPPEEHQLRVLDFLAEVADGTTELTQLVQVPHSGDTSGTTHHWRGGLPRRTAPG
jgi:hypothetical protein